MGLIDIQLIYLLDPLIWCWEVLMESIILGLLMVRGMTIYEIKSFINNKLDTMCSASSGSIHTSIKKLLGKEAIALVEVDNKKVYFITLIGREQFNIWIKKPMDVKKAKNIELSKMFFFGLSDYEDRRGLIESYVNDLKIERDKLLAIYNMMNENKEEIIAKGLQDLKNDKWNDEGIKSISNNVLNDKVIEIFEFQQATLDYGLSEVKFQIVWYSKFLKKYEGELL